MAPELLSPTRDQPTQSPLSERRLAQWKQDRQRPAMYSDWDRTLMIHYAVDPRELQPQIPFDLDTFDGLAYVSFVAFTIRRLRPAWLPGHLHPLTRPISEHGFLNLRTYVHCNGTAGIYFLAEWLPNRLSILLGPPLYGLPYRFGRLHYDHRHEQGLLRGHVQPADEPDELRYQHTGPPMTGFGPAPRGSLDEFVLERYTAFTQRGRARRRFDIWHEPWPQQRIDDLHLTDDRLLTHTGPWHRHASLATAHYSPGVRHVWMGHPVRLPPPRP